MSYDYRPPEIDGMTDDDVYQIAEMVTAQLDRGEQRFGFMREFHTHVSDNGYMNAHMDDLIADTIDALDANDAWRAPNKVNAIIRDNVLGRGAEYIVLRYGDYLEREFTDSEIDGMYDALNRMPQGHTNIRRQQKVLPFLDRYESNARGGYALGRGGVSANRDHSMGRRGNSNHLSPFAGRTPIFQAGSQPLREIHAGNQRQQQPMYDAWGRPLNQPQGFGHRRDEYGSGPVNIAGAGRGKFYDYNRPQSCSQAGFARREIEDNPLGHVFNGSVPSQQVGTQYFQAPQTNERGRSGGVDISNVSMRNIQQHTRAQEMPTPPPRQQQPVRQTPTAADIWNAHSRANQPMYPNHQANKPQQPNQAGNIPPVRVVSKPSKNKGETVKHNGIILIHQNANSARTYVNRYGGKLIPKRGVEVFFEEGTGKIHTVPEGEIKLDKALHRTEQFFKAWMPNDVARDPDATKQSLKALQQRKLISVLEEELSKKYDNEDDSKLNSELFNTMIYINDHDLMSSSHSSATAQEAKEVLATSIVEGSVLDGKDFDCLCVNYLSRSISDWLVSPGDESANRSLSEMRLHTKITDIKDMILNARNYLPYDVVKDLNRRATNWINKILHRYWGCAPDCIDSFVGDIDDVVANLDRLNIDKSSWETAYRRNKDTLFNLVTLDKAKLDKYELEYEEGTQALIDYVDVTKLAIRADEFDLMIDKFGRGVVNKQVNPELYEALNAIVEKVALDMIDTIKPREHVIITNDSERMYLTKITRDSIVVSRY